MGWAGGRQKPGGHRPTSDSLLVARLREFRARTVRHISNRLTYDRAALSSSALSLGDGCVAWSKHRHVLGGAFRVGWALSPPLQTRWVVVDASWVFALQGEELVGLPPRPTLPVGGLAVSFS